MLPDPSVAPLLTVCLMVGANFFFIGLWGLLAGWR